MVLICFLSSVVADGKDGNGLKLEIGSETIDHCIPSS